MVRSEFNAFAKCEPLRHLSLLRARPLRGRMNTAVLRAADQATVGLLVRFNRLTLARVLPA